MLVIKPLSEAARQWDMIRAVIRSASSNHDGTTPRFDQPNIDSQSLLIEDTYLKAGLGLDKTQYFEANGQGTAEDRIINTALTFNRDNDRGCRGSPRRWCSFPQLSLRKGSPVHVRPSLALVKTADKIRSSVKSNIGHLEGASGIAALIKAILSFERGIIPPNSSNFQTLNQHIDETRLQIKVGVPLHAERP